MNGVEGGNIPNNVTSASGDSVSGGKPDVMGAVDQFDGAVADKFSKTPKLGEKAGLSKNEAKAVEANQNSDNPQESNTNAPTTPDGEEIPEDAPKPGEKLGDGKKIGKDGKVEETSSRKVIRAGGTAVATYFGGAKGAQVASKIGNSQTGGNIIGKVADVSDKIPGVEQVSEKVDEMGAADIINGAAKAFGSYESKDVNGMREGVKEAKTGAKKLTKFWFKKIVLPGLLLLAFITIIVVPLIVGPTQSGFSSSTEEYGSKPQVTDVNPDDVDDELEDVVIPATGKLKDLFPDGLPTTPEQMAKYLKSVSIVVLDKNGNRTTKSITVHKDLVDKVAAMFKELADSGFRAYDVQTYSWRSMATSSNRSHHSYGVAIDINPNENPMIDNNGKTVAGGTYNPSANPYTTLTQKQANIFAKYGFAWGGNWKSSHDYMHISYTGY